MFNFARLLTVSKWTSWGMASAVLISACGTGTHVVQRRDHPFTVATYNVENLYDTTHDSEHANPIYIPLSEKKDSSAHYAACRKLTSAFLKEQCLQLDWSESQLNSKLQRIADTVLTMTEKGPDILILQEVENLNVLKKLNERFLSSADYSTVVLLKEKNEKDLHVAVLSRLDKVGVPILHEIPFAPDPGDASWKAPVANGILEVPLSLPNGERMIVYGFQFPAGNSKVQERQDAVLFLNSLKAQKNKTTVVIAGGDSQITPQEEIRTHLQKQVLGSEWAVSHLQGCKGCEGTEYKQSTWSFSDLLLFSPSLDSEGAAPYVLSDQSIRIYKGGAYQLNPDQTPAAFEHVGSVGVSSHLPVFAEIQPR